MKNYFFYYFIEFIDVSGTPINILLQKGKTITPGKDGNMNVTTYP